MKVALIGGSGKLGKGFATRLAQTGHEVAIGSRDAAKAQDAAREAGGSVLGMTNLDAAAWCEVAILSIPYQGRRTLLEPLRDALRGKIIIDTTVPIDPTDMLKATTETGKSAAEETEEIFPDTEVFAAFQTVSHRVLQQPELKHDVLVAGPNGRKVDVIELIRSMGLHPVDAGPLRAAGLLERMTLLLISVNKANKVKESGFHVTGLADH
jgi:NADPH-dependent F420 reductase